MPQVRPSHLPELQGAKLKMPNSKPVSQLAGEPLKCEHGNNAETCRTCIRLDNAWNDLGNTLREMGDEEPGW
jgi:hypothetical protein